MKKTFFIVSLFLLMLSNSFSQIKISGTLKTENEKPIAGASITITELNTEDILNYAISDKNGGFSILVKSDAKKIQLNIRTMGYKAVADSIDNKTQIIDYILTEEVTELKEVVLKNHPITRRGDTINYSVNAFAKQADRTIADVLKNMPGIEVLSDGRIMYQGKPINKYYIEGLDLLEGKYNLANSNLPHKEVRQIQVLENHQPIKLLDSLVFSERAAINIKLKNSYTFTGQAEIGTGLSPMLWEVNLTPMLFSKKQQMLTSYQTNNTGNDVGTQIKPLTIDELLDQFERNDEKQDWLAIQQLKTPGFSEQRWLDNNIHLLSTNYLYKLKNDYELRLNLSYLNDYQQQNGVTDTQFFTVNDTIALFENKYNQLHTNTLETNLTLQKNTKKNFLKNSLQLQKFWDSQQGHIQLNTDAIHQNLSNRYFKLSNDLKTLFPLGKQIVTLTSYIGFNKTPQSLIINPGQFNDLINDANDYDQITQNIELQTFYTNNSLGFTKGWKQFSVSPKLGVQFEKQNLESAILTPSITTLNNEFENNLDWLRSKVYFNLTTQYKKNKWRVNLTTAVNLHNYQLEDQTLQKGQNLDRVTFEPRLSLSYDLNSFWRLGASSHINHQFGTINQVHYNYILQNYRTIKRIDSPLPEMRNFRYSMSLNYRNPIKSHFFNLNYNRAITENNLLYNNKILENGAIELQAIEKTNHRYSHNFMTRMGKYFSDYNTNLTISANYSLQDFQQILNTEITDISNSNWHLSGKINTDITSWLNTELESIFQFSNNKIQKQNNQTITQQFHRFNINIYPKENQYIALKTEYISNNLFSKNATNLFADIIYRYTWDKKKIDFELQWNNIFNTTNYRTVNIDNFSYIETNFNLRPNQLLVKVRFSL